jgi:aryl-alcohol dehydrogenase-like predicted oxidoreductase
VTAELRLLLRFSKGNFPSILSIIDRIQKIGEKHNATTGQVTLAWILAQGDEFHVIPGTKKIKVSEPRAVQDTVLIAFGSI